MKHTLTLAERLDLTILELQIQPPYFGDA